MSQTLSVSDSVFAVAAMVKSGKLREAKRTTAQLLDNVHPSVLALLRECADILCRPNAVARPKLTALWQRSDQTGRKIIEACAPARDEWDHRQVAELPAVDHPRLSAPPQSPHTTRRGTPASRAELRARRDQRQARKDTAAYFAQRTEVDDQPRNDDRPDGYAIDYDHAAVPALRGTPCVCCWLERSNADQTTSRRNDDGLCSDCREKARPGIPELPAGHSRADAITARCALIAAKYHPDTARAILRNEWHRAQTAQDRAAIAEWVQANAATVDAPAAPVPAPVATMCGTCGATRQVRDGQCVDCRTLDAEPIPASGSAIDPDAQSARSIAGPRLNSDRGRGAASDSPAAPGTVVTASRRYQRRHRQALPPNTVYVGRPTRFGNPFRCDPTPAARADAVRQYRQWISTQPELIEQARAELTGRTLACWCPIDGPCHADVLLEITDAPAPLAA